MSRFKRATVDFRGETFIVRDWSPAERSVAIKARDADPSSFSSSVAYSCTIKEDGSRFFANEAAAKNEPTALVDALCAKVLELAGFADEKDETGPNG